MPSAQIYRFPSPARRRPELPARVCYVLRPRSPFRSGGFALLWSVTLPAAFLYLSGAAGVARHDALYGTLLAAVWGFFFGHDKLLRVRVLGPLLILSGQLLVLAAVVG